MSEKPKQINFNTVLLSLVNILVLIVAFFSKHELERMEASQQKLWEAIMPRHEIEVQIQELRSENTRLAGEHIDFRTRIGKMEIDLARMQKTP